MAKIEFAGNAGYAMISAVSMRLKNPESARHYNYRLE